MTQLHLGWHFCALKEDKPVLRDNTPLVIGKTYTHEGPLQMCSTGYHDSAKILDALSYAPGTYLCRTLASVDEVGDDKRVSRSRIAIAGCDATHTLVEFAAKAAYCALLAERDHGREPDPRSWDAVRSVMAWLMGYDVHTRGAAESARGAAESARGARGAWGAWSAAKAAESAARAAAESAAWAAESAAWAAESAARDARDARDADEFHNELLLSLLPEEIKIA